MSETDLDLKQVVGVVKKVPKRVWVILALVLILGIGFHLRMYHADYPPIGYHNWKEVHYLSEARNFAEDGFFAHGFFVPERDLFNLPDHNGVHSDTVPTISIVVGVAFKLFGSSLFVARLVNVLFALGSVLLFYLVIKKLFHREDLALTCAALLSLNPLLVFFGRQMQLINPALFFTLLGAYWYLFWIESFSWKTTIGFAVAFSLGVLTKLTFAIFILPLGLLFPFKRILKKDVWPKVLVVLGIAALFLMWQAHLWSIDAALREETGAVNFSNIRDAQFWQIMRSFAADNYSLLGVKYAIAGAILFSLMSLKFWKKRSYQFMGFYLLSSLAWFVYLSEKLRGHNYHQYPFLPLVVFMMGFGIVFLATNISSFASSFLPQYKRYVSPGLRLVLIILFALPLLGPMEAGANRMWDTQFFGLDVAGDYVNQHKQPGDIAIRSSHQAYGFVWHSDMPSLSIPATVAEFEYMEQNLGARWLFVYAWDFHIFQDEPIIEHISNNYGLVQAGFMRRGEQIAPQYMLFERGGTFNQSELVSRVQTLPPQIREYELTRGNVQLTYFNFPRSS